MCAKKSVTASGCRVRSQNQTPSPISGNTIRFEYRSWSVPPRGVPLSPVRKCAGRKALSGLKVSSPDKQFISVVATRVLISEATPGDLVLLGTTGVQVHGEYRRQLLELGRSPQGRTRMFRVNGQGIRTKSKTIPSGEVRWVHGSEEVG